VLEPVGKPEFSGVFEELEDEFELILEVAPRTGVGLQFFCQEQLAAFKLRDPALVGQHGCIACGFRDAVEHLVDLALGLRQFGTQRTGRFLNLVEALFPGPLEQRLEGRMHVRRGGELA